MRLAHEPPPRPGAGNFELIPSLDFPCPSPPFPVFLRTDKVRYLCLLLAACRSRVPRGFTLLEVLVSVAILSLVVVLLASVFSSVQSGLVFTDGGARQRQDAASVLARMAEELRSSMAPVSQSHELANPATRQAQLLVNPSGLAPSLQNAGAIFWKAPVRSATGGSGLVGYFLRWDTSIPDRPHPFFCRFSLDPRQSEAAAQALRANGADTAWINTALADTQAPGDQDNGFQGWLADNILAFYVRVLDPEMSALTRQARQVRRMYYPASLSPNFVIEFSSPNQSAGPLIDGNRFDSRLGYQYQRTSDGRFVDRYGPALPPLVELIVIAAPPKAVGRLTVKPAIPNSNDPAKVWEDVDAFIAGLPEAVRREAKIYSTLIALPASPR